MGPTTADPTVWWRIKTGQYVRCEARVLPSAWQHFHVFHKPFHKHVCTGTNTLLLHCVVDAPCADALGAGVAGCSPPCHTGCCSGCVLFCVRTYGLERCSLRSQLERSQTPKCVHLGSLRGAPRLPSVRSNVKGSARHNTGQITQGFQLLGVTQLQLGSHACW